MADRQVDHELCATLHNEIFKRGWEGTGEPFDLDSFPVFWDTLTQHHTDLTQRLQPSLIEFFKKARVIRNYGDSQAPYQQFFYFLAGLVNPVTTWARDHLDSLDAVNPDHYILLYGATNIASQSLGIIFDQERCKATMQISLASSDILNPDLKWEPLETILRTYLDIVDIGKVTAFHYDPDEYGRAFQPGASDPQPPWKIHSYSDQILSRTIRAYEKLIQSIEDRMPSADDVPAQLTSGSHLANDAILDRGNFHKEGFVRSFLTQASAPRKGLRYIAPGVRLPDETSLTGQPFREIGTYYRYGEMAPGAGAIYMPIHLFPIDGEVTQDDLPENDNPPFEWPFQDIPRYPPGLWILDVEPLSAVPYEDASKFILPFAVGDAGHAKSNDGVAIRPASKTKLYQNKFNPYLEPHCVQLYLILENWAEMVERGDWDVDAGGVAGGIDKFRDVDRSDELSERYRLPVTW